MKVILNFYLFLFISAFMHAQNSNLSLEVSYPLPVDDNFVGRNYNGIANLGVKYIFADARSFDFGASLDLGALTSSKERRVQGFNVFALFIQPRVFVALDSEAIPKFHPALGIGYSILVFHVARNEFTDPNFPEPIDTTQSNEGVNVNASLAYDITDRFYAQIQYDFLKVSYDGNLPDLKYNRNVNLFKIGVGYRL
ncbi:hypothetical protein [Cochleicola gelatinilyticus]|uniref:Outer membrane protein beta-barrel domain-containing protein n=1 Tax=Cochleicola gelatinilyticus TaxID=1763537 RepID=A0A167GA40_9FLAO|nr:hypothetical protein [Cochleicola gelatinilyticus]OAB77374.1 hypothetical protein ULVI_12805 [Cochleicola gelatinilyticus]